MSLRPPWQFLSPATTSVKAGHVLLVNSMAMWMLAFMTTSINVALPSIQSELDLGAVALGWLPLAYILASAIFLLPFGKIADRFGRRLLYLLGLIIFFASSLALVFADSYVPLVAFRSTQGFGGALMFAGSTAMITLAYPPDRRGRAMGIHVAVVYLGQTMGPILGGVIVFNIGWRSLFVFGACYALVCLGLDLWLLRRAEWKDDEASGSDWPGSIVYAVSLSCFLLGLSWIPRGSGVALTAAGAAGIALFVWWETRARSPVIEVGLFRHNRVFAFSNMAALISYASVWAMSFLMTLYLQLIKGLNAQTAGLVLVAGVAVQALFSPVGGRLSDRVQARWVASGGMALCTLGLLALSFLVVDTPYWYIALGLILLGLGYAFFSGPNQSSIMSSVEQRFVGVAGATVGTMRLVGQAMSIAMATMVLGVVVGTQTIQPADYPDLLSAIRVTFVILAALSVVGLAASLARGPTHAHEKPAEVAGSAADL
jgi:MFS family permease